MAGGAKPSPAHAPGWLNILHLPAPRVRKLTACLFAQGGVAVPFAWNPYKIEKFSKTLVNVTPADNGYSAVIGDTWENRALTNPATVRPGNELTVKVLFKAQP
jgi:hypothetical protein